MYLLYHIYMQLGTTWLKHQNTLRFDMKYTLHVENGEYNFIL